MRPRKRFGQHWLKDERALNTIVKSAQLEPSDRVLEIGPGRGSLTRRLLATGAPTVSVEIDRDLCRLLRQTLTSEHFLLIEGDILHWDWQAALAEQPTFANPNKVVANIPYNLTGPILEILVGTFDRPRVPALETIVLLLQQEVADRLTTTPGNKAWGALSVRVQFLAHCELVDRVPASSFAPPPKVDSAIVRLQPRAFPLQPQSAQQLGQIVKLGFANRRKMLRNNLKSFIPSDRLTDLLMELGMDGRARAETLSIEHWIRLSDRLQDC